MEVFVPSQFQCYLFAAVPKPRCFAISLTGNATDGDDLVQSACGKALRNHDQVQIGTRFDSWVYRIVQTLWLDDIRKRKVCGPILDPDDIRSVTKAKAPVCPKIA